MVFVLAAEEEGSRVPREGDPPTALTPSLKLVTLTEPLWTSCRKGCQTPRSLAIHVVFGLKLRRQYRGLNGATKNM